MRVAPLLMAASALHAPAAQPAQRAVVLLADNRVVELSLPAGKVVARTRVGPKPRSDPPSAGRMLARSDTRLFVLVHSGTSPDSVAVLDTRTTRLRARWELEPGVLYRGIVFGGDRLYAYGGRRGREVDTTDHIREQSAVVTQLDAANGQKTGTTTIRAAEGHMWWTYWGAFAAAGRLLLSYHGGCGAASSQLCTSGADWIDVHGETLTRCDQDASRPFLGCLEEAHGMVEPFGVGWIAATGGESLVQYGRSGNVLRRLHSGIRRDHVMNFTFTHDRTGLLLISSCNYSREGLRRISLATGKSALVRRNICGDAVIASRTNLVVRNGSAIELRTSRTGQLRHTARFGSNLLDVLVTG